MSMGFKLQRASSSIYRIPQTCIPCLYQITVVFRSIRTSHVPRHPNLYEMSHVSCVPSFLFETIPQVVDPLFFYAPSAVFLSVYYTNISGMVFCPLHLVSERIGN